MTLGKPVALHCSTVKIGRKSKVVYTTVGRAGSGEGASKRPSRMWGCTVQTAQEEATPASLPLRRPRLTAPGTRCRLWIVACHLHEHRATSGIRPRCSSVGTWAEPVSENTYGCPSAPQPPTSGEKKRRLHISPFLPPTQTSSGSVSCPLIRTDFVSKAIADRQTLVYFPFWRRDHGF